MPVLDTSLILSNSLNGIEFFVMGEPRLHRGIRKEEEHKYTNNNCNETKDEEKKLKEVSLYLEILWIASILTCHDLKLCLLL